MLFGRKKGKNISNLDLQVGALFEKNDKVPSVFVVDKVLDFSPAPIHVRLKEKGGNERTVTVALETLMDETFWRSLPNN